MLVATCDNANQSMSACGLKVLCGTHLLVKKFRLALRLLRASIQWTAAAIHNCLHTYAVLWYTVILYNHARTSKTCISGSRTVMADPKGPE